MPIVYGVVYKNKIHYVGCTLYAPEKRLREFISMGKHKHGGNQQFKQWAWNNRSAITVIPLETVSQEEAKHRERDWIEYLLKQGEPLMNRDAETQRLVF